MWVCDWVVMSHYNYWEDVHNSSVLCLDEEKWIIIAAINFSCGWPRSWPGPESGSLSRCIYLVCGAEIVRLCLPFPDSVSSALGFLFWQFKDRKSTILLNFENHSVKINYMSYRIHLRLGYWYSCYASYVGALCCAIGSCSRTQLFTTVEDLIVWVYSYSDVVQLINAIEIKVKGMLMDVFVETILMFSVFFSLALHIPALRYAKVFERLNYNSTDEYTYVWIDLISPGFSIVNMLPRCLRVEYSLYLCVHKPIIAC